MKKRNNVLLLLVVLAAIGAFTWKDSLSSMMAEKETGPLELFKAARPVPTASVQLMSAVESRTFPGSVRAKRRVEIGFSVAGLLEELNVLEGKNINKGDVLARLDPRDFQHALDASLASFNDAQRAYERAKDLHMRKVISKAKYDAAQTAYEVAGADLKLKRKALADTVLYAPFDGVVSKRYVENYEHVKERTPVVAFKDLTMIEVVAKVPERLIAKGGVEQFDAIAVKFDAEQDVWFPATIREYSVQSDPVLRTYEVVVTLSPPASLEILPGMTATVRLQSTLEPAGVAARFSVPVESLVGGNDGKSYVWVIPASGGNPKKTEVTVGSLTNNGVVILQGLSGKEQVATAAVHTLLEEMQVRPVADGKEGLDG
ncbi:efflux RND transporter periplasmic adaptor subunit [Desulfogranum marinum]|jgi:RND family efflux transporter MFP subunit|uniref:efflux RND transporter periplasmic adaptor subunit n=1 Tax=Desulfogranum marinum TaxID=453220 RepID=UPI0019667E5B|nr:efflux RND transporter periplasmic adaptor subunit [Desulfogranum marinum]MBM9511462.1 efflux RND transporter periplasmic adaptor subunit [Desulfogranum marinum]